MSDERIDIEIKDGVSTEIATKILNISSAAKEGYNSLEQLKRQLKSLTSSGLSQLKTQLDGLNSAINKNALANEKLAQAQAKTAAASAKAQVQQQNVTNAQIQGAIATQRLASAQQLAAQKIAAAHANQAQRIAAAQAISNQRLLTAQQQTNNTALRGQLVQQRLATAQNQTAAAASRAALAQNRLQNALNRVNTASQGASFGMGSFIRRFAAIAGVTLTTGALIEAADAFTILQNKMRVVAESERGLETMTQGVFDVANRTRSSVTDTATAFVRFDLAMKQLGGSQAETLQMTETVNKALLLSGANTKEAASGLLQLSQAMNKGKLDGDEFRSVMELMPMIADSIAKKMGVARGELLNLAPQGKITAKILKDALAASAKEIDEKFNKTIPTIGQSVEILKNKLIQTFGEINKKLGITSGIATAFKFIGDHIKGILVALSALGIALLAVFGPTLLTMLSAAASAVWAFTVALMTNPIGLLAVGIGAAITAIALFGDEITVTADKQVTLKDTAIGTWNVIKQNFTQACDYFRGLWNSTIDWLSSKTNGWGEKFRDIIGLLLGLWKTFANAQIGIGIGAMNAILNNYQLVPGALRDIFAMALNWVIDITEKMINGVMNGINSITSFINKASEKVGLGKMFDADLEVSLDKYKMEVTGAAHDLAANVHDTFSAALSVDYIGNAMSAIEAEARKVADARRKAEADKGTGLRGTGPAAVIGDPKALKEAERRRLEMDKLNRSLSEELTLLQRKQTDDYVENRLLEITNNMLDKKIKLTTDETKAIREKLEAIQKQRSSNEVAEITRELEREYKVLQSVREERWQDNKLTEIEQRLKEKQMILTDEERKKIQALLGVMQEQRTANAINEINRQLRQESTLLDILGPQREIQQELNQIENEQRQKGNFLSKEQLGLLQKELELLQRKKLVDTELQAIYDSTVGAQKQLQYKEEALYQAFSKNIITMDQYKMRFNQLAIEAANLRLQLGQGTIDDIALSTIGNYISGYTNMLDGLKNNFQSFFTALGDGFADSLGRAIVFSDNLGESLMRVGQEAMATLISGLIKLGIQWALNMAVGKALSHAFMASQMASSAAMAAATASAWAPAAAMVSLATMGMNAVGAMTGIGATTALTQGLALTSLAGFKRGGYTGDKDSSAIAGVVHGREFVMNAQATAANRPALETMNAGGTLSPQMNVYIEHDGSTAVQAVQIDENTVRIWARQESMNTLQSHGPHVIASDLNNPNSKTSKAIGRNTETRRRR